MAAEMPARVEAVDGAAVVDFPWEAAGSAVEAYNAASSTLESQLGARPDMVGTLDDWLGTFRDDFDDTYARLTTVAGGLKERFTSLASLIVGGAEDANAEQRQNNQQAEWRREHPGQQVPI